MRARRYALASLAALAITVTPVGTAGADPTPEVGDATVIAVIDSGFSPYHWDFLASQMPQALDGNPATDLPLDQAPHTWLPGFPEPDAFTSYNRFDLALDDLNPAQPIAELRTKDADEWNAVVRSTEDESHYYWFPGTKVIGGLTFSSSGRIEAGSGSHGHGTSSVSVGNMFGTCPECLLVFIQYGSAADGERAIEWAESQPWIDAISNSYGFSLVERDRLYSGSDVDAQRAASERGQTILFSAGNGISNTFTIPNSTLFSSQEGPDWIVTVGAVHPTTEGSYTGSGKPADIAGVGSAYPSSYNASAVGVQGGNFSGTSNATPTIAGTYGRALHLARRALPGPSRIQEDGTIAVARPAEGEDPFVCGSARPDCELEDGVLTSVELRTRLFHGARHTPGGMTVGQVNNQPTPVIGEDEFVNEGHGTYFGRLRGTEAWLEEFQRVIGPLAGESDPLQRPAGEAEWMIVDSFCRQHLWGSWTDGYFLDGQTSLPGPAPQSPLRSTIEAACPGLFPPV